MVSQKPWLCHGLLGEGERERERERERRERREKREREREREKREKREEREEREREKRERRERVTVVMFVRMHAAFIPRLLKPRHLGHGYVQPYPIGESHSSGGTYCQLLMDAL